MPRSTATRVVRTAESFAKLAASGPDVERTFLNTEIGRDRRVSFAVAELDALKDAREGQATVNDVILSVAAGRFLRRSSRWSR
jgi:hypothetical protein